MSVMESQISFPIYDKTLSDLPGERWVVIYDYLKGVDGKYAVSSMGRVKRIERVILTWRGGKRIMSEKVLPQKNDSRGTNGYMRVGLSIDTTSRDFIVHRLVAHCFLGNIKNKPYIQVNHINFNTHDNRVSNLELVTREENIKHYQNEIIKRLNNGERVSNYRFTKEEIIDIYFSKEKMKDISAKYNVNWKTIKDIKLGYSFKHITESFPRNNPRRKPLTIDQIIDIYSNRNNPVKIMEEKYALSQGCVIAVRTGRRHSDITGHIREGNPHR